MTIIYMAHPSVERGDDKEWGMTDCISFIVMEDHGLTDAFNGRRAFSTGRIPSTVTGR